jgi:translocation and assembly module TamA
MKRHVSGTLRDAGQCLSNEETSAVAGRAAGVQLLSGAPAFAGPYFSRMLVCAFLVVFASGAHAAYKVDIDAPRPIRKLLNEFLDLSRYKDREDLSPEQLRFMVETAPDQVRSLLATEGYFSPETRARIDEEDGRRVVRIDVDPGPRTIVEDVDIDATGAVAQLEPERINEIRRGWDLPKGKPFRQEDWEAAKNEGLRNLQRRRYAAAKIADSKARIVPKEQKADLSVQYDSGPAFTLGELEISGAERYPKDIVRNVNPLQVGEDYSVDRLLELQRQVQGTPYYANVIVNVEEDPAKAKLAPVHVQLTEFPTQRIRAGVGYATDTGAAVEGRYTHYNVFDKAYVFDGHLRLEQERQFGSLELAMPPDEKSFVNKASTSLERSTLEGVELRSLRAGIRRSRTREKIDIAYSIDYFLDELLLTSGAPLPPNTPITPGRHQALVPAVAWTRRNVDDPVFPREGNIISLQAGAAVKGILTDQSFVRLYGRIKHYVPVGRRDILILRGEAGGAISKGGASDIPASLLFRAGGTESVRGYSYQSIGNEQNGVVFPTKYLATASAEYQRWFTEEWGGAAFYDVGTAADSFSDRTLYQGFGAGVRYRSPVGPINVDIAYGVEDRRIRPHISLGIAF